MPDSPNMLAAKAVAELLNVRPFPTGVELPGGITFTATARRYPKWKLDELKMLTVVAIPATPYTASALDRSEGVERDCPVNVAVLQKIERHDQEAAERLMATLDTFVELLCRVPLAAFGFPNEDEGVEAEWDPVELEENGLFLARVSVVYRHRDEAED